MARAGVRARAVRQPGATATPGSTSAAAASRARPARSPAARSKRCRCRCRTRAIAQQRIAPASWASGDYDGILTLGPGGATPALDAVRASGARTCTLRDVRPLARRARGGARRQDAVRRRPAAVPAGLPAGDAAGRARPPPASSRAPGELIPTGPQFVDQARTRPRSTRGSAPGASADRRDRQPAVGVGDQRLGHGRRVQVQGLGGLQPVGLVLRVMGVGARPDRAPSGAARGRRMGLRTPAAAGGQPGRASRSGRRVRVGRA